MQSKGCVAIFVSPLQISGTIMKREEFQIRYQEDLNLWYIQSKTGYLHRDGTIALRCGRPNFFLSKLEAEACLARFIGGNMRLDVVLVTPVVKAVDWTKVTIRYNSSRQTFTIKNVDGKYLHPDGGWCDKTTDDVGALSGEYLTKESAEAILRKHRPKVYFADLLKGEKFTVPGFSWGKCTKVFDCDRNRHVILNERHEVVGGNFDNNALVVERVVV